ncbi:fimbrial biogenesis chaperone, partial [Klebsiella pasteurii]|uniref:fimbrial biogenesis chaperone n=4 Tax=Klebsiella/Raoultella group TaxID=2890311 RepID=UPI0035D204F0
FQIKNNNQQVVIMSNPTPWYMTIATFESGYMKIDSIMLAPGEKKEITLNKTVKAGEVQYEIINDDGTKWRYRSFLRQS